MWSIQTKTEKQWHSRFSITLLRNLITADTSEEWSNAGIKQAKSDMKNQTKKYRLHRMKRKSIAIMQ